jgi:hypothetical protein
LIKAIAESAGRSVQQIKNELERTGDLGDIAMKSKGAQPTMFRPSPLTVMGVFKSLKEIAMTSGTAVNTIFCFLLLFFACFCYCFLTFHTIHNANNRANKRKSE